MDDSRHKPERGRMMLSNKKSAGPDPGRGRTRGYRLSPSTGNPLEPAPAAAKVRIVLVESHTILRDGLAALLDRETDLQVVGSTGNASSVAETICALQPDLVITDVVFPDLSGLVAIRAMVGLDPTLRLLVLTASDDEENIRAALNLGVHGYVLKDSGRGDLLGAIRTVMSGKQFLCPAVAAKVVSGFVSGFEPRPAVRCEDLVTGRERQVLTRIALGQSNKLIARDLCLSVKTVEKHRANLMRKLTLHNTAAVTRFALRHGLIDAEPAVPIIRHLTVAPAV